MNNQRKKQLTAVYERYLRSTDTSLYDVYKTPSSAKLSAERSIITEKVDRNGRDYRIVSYNTNIFTCGYIFTNHNGDTVFRYHTPTWAGDLVIN